MESWSLNKWVGHEIKVTFAGGSLEHRSGILVFFDPSGSEENPRWLVITNPATQAEVLIYTSAVACVELAPESNLPHLA